MVMHILQQPSYDPNWFYSSLSQAAAALIGLLGGIMATRLDAQQREARKARDDFESAVVTARRTVEEFWKALRGQADDLGALLTCLEAMREVSTLDELRKGARRLVESSKGIPAWKDRGAAVSRDVGIASSAHADLRRKADSRIYARLLGVLALLSVAGLLAPLAFLSAHDQWSKATLLGGFTLGVLGLLGFIGYQVRYLRRIRTRALTFDR